MAFEQAPTAVSHIDIAVLRQVDGPCGIYRPSQWDFIDHSKTPTERRVRQQLTAAAMVSGFSRLSSEADKTSGRRTGATGFLVSNVNVQLR
jgi:hypothetical protein